MLFCASGVESRTKRQSYCGRNEMGVSSIKPFQLRNIYLFVICRLLSSSIHTCFPLSEVHYLYWVPVWAIFSIIFILRYKQMNPYAGYNQSGYGGTPNDYNNGYSDPYQGGNPQGGYGYDNGYNQGGYGYDNGYDRREDYRRDDRRGEWRDDRRHHKHDKHRRKGSHEFKRRGSHDYDRYGREDYGYRHGHHGNKGGCCCCF